MKHSNWFITGINRGLGRHMAEQLLASGNKVFGTSRQLEQLAELKAAYPEQLYLAELDLTDTLAIDSVVARAFAELGCIDAIVSNAGYSLVAAAEEASAEEIKQQLDTNLLGSIHLARAALPHLRNQGGGRLIQISSSVGQSSIPGVSLYVASKWGIEGFYEALATEIAPFNIEVTLVEPGGIRTGFAAQAVVGRELPVYRDTPAGIVRQFVSGGFPDAPGDPARMASMIIDSFSQSPAPFRLVLGSDSYTGMKADLERRLAQLEAQASQASLSDFPAIASA